MTVVSEKDEWLERLRIAGMATVESIALAIIFFLDYGIEVLGYKLWPMGPPWHLNLARIAVLVCPGMAMCILVVRDLAILAIMSWSRVGSILHRK